MVEDGTNSKNLPIWPREKASSVTTNIRSRRPVWNETLRSGCGVQDGDGSERTEISKARAAGDMVGKSRATSKSKSEILVATFCTARKSTIINVEVLCRSAARDGTASIMWRSVKKLKELRSISNTD